MTAYGVPDILAAPTHISDFIPTILFLTRGMMLRREDEQVLGHHMITVAGQIAQQEGIADDATA